MAHLACSRCALWAPLKLGHNGNVVLLHPDERCCWCQERRATRLVEAECMNCDERTKAFVLYAFEQAAH